MRLMQNIAASLLVAAVIRRPFRRTQGPGLVEGLTSGVATAASRRGPLPRRSPASRKAGGFSLLEVIVAIGLFASSVAVVLALLPALTRSAISVQDYQAAQRLPDAFKVELKRLAAAGGFDALASRVPVQDSAGLGGLAFLAPADAARVLSKEYLPPGGAPLGDADQYYLIECWRFPDDPLRFEAQEHCLALAVRVSWPYRVPGSSAPTVNSGRSQFDFTISLTR